MKRTPFLSSNNAIAILLAVSLLFAQALGLLHNIAHAGWHHVHGHTSAQQHAYASSESDLPPDALTQQEGRELALFGHAADDDEEHGDHHACAEYDAAAVAHCIHMQAPLLIPLPSTHVLAVWRAFASWDAPLITCFSSRAPPTA